MAEKSKRPKFIVTGFIFSLWIILFLLITLIFFILPKLKEISNEKEDVKNKIQSIKNVSIKGLSYSEFNSMKGTVQNNAYLMSLLKKTDEQFYNLNFVNNKQWEDYNSFISKKTNEINKSEKDISYKEIKESYKSILPTYVENNYENEEWVMTDLKFITYIESILYTFNLEMANKNLTIWNLNLLPDYNNEKGSPLDTTIFYIPYTFDITWKKSNILDFIYFLENVWSIKITDDAKIEVFEDNFINKSLNWFDEWNILRNEIIDIEKIEISDYIDSWLETKGNENLITFIKRTQWNEKVAIKIDVRFYVKWLPNYKIQESIDKLVARFDGLKKDFEKAKNDKKLSADEKVTITRGIWYLKELEITINEIKKDKNDLNNVYKKTLDVNKLLDLLQNTLKK